MLNIHNSLTGSSEILKPLTAGKLRMYVCGITVYDYCHIGHARMIVVFDVVARYLRASGYELQYVRNITDIDDKIIRRAAENGESISELTERFITAMNEDFAALGTLPPDQEPRATAHMPQIISMIEQLIANGHAYCGDNGDVYFNVGSFDDYGKLSGKRLADLRVGARIAVDEAKQDALDFVLWKAAKAGEPSWDSPWGAGRPGWHIECSAMSTHCLGDHFDIHGGGLDLKFPHHENEIAQSVCATHSDFANLWMHNGFVQIDDEKMSKSLGNFFTIREVLARYKAEVLRYFIVNSHYRSPLNYSDQHLDQADASLRRLYTALRGLDSSGAEVSEPHQARFKAAMDDDFNTPVALSVLFDLAHDINRLRDSDPEQAALLARSLKQLAEPLGLLQADPDQFLQAGLDGELADDEASEIDALIAARNQARVDKDWPEADRIRDELAARNILLEDSNGVTTWRKA